MARTESAPSLHFRLNQHRWTLQLDLKARTPIHELITAYGVDNRVCLPSEQTRDESDLCKTEKKPEAIPTPKGLTVYYY